MPSELRSVIGKLARGEKLSPPAVDEIERLLQALQNEGWSGFLPADEAVRAIRNGETEELVGLLRDLRTYTAKLEAASAAWFVTHRQAKRPDPGDLAERLDAVLGKGFADPI